MNPVLDEAARITALIRQHPEGSPVAWRDANGNTHVGVIIDPYIPGGETPRARVRRDDAPLVPVLVALDTLIPVDDRGEVA